MNINFYSIDIFDDNGKAAGKKFLKSWFNWKGAVPQEGDIILLHWHEQDGTAEEAWRVVTRVINGEDPKKLEVFMTQLESFDI